MQTGSKNNRQKGTGKQGAGSNKLTGGRTDMQGVVEYTIICSQVGKDKDIAK
jgi:hypothetical protein